MEEIRAYKGSSADSLGSDFQSNLLIFKRHVHPKAYNEVLCASIIGYPSEVKEFDCANRKIIISHQKPGMYLETFVIPNSDDYQTRMEPRGEFVELIFERKVDAIIRKEDENDKDKKPPSYPLLFIRNGNEEQQKTKLYKMVKNGVTTPMFPNVEEHLILAGQLFVDKEEAKTILDVLYGRSVQKVDAVVLERAKYLIQTYKKWKEYLFVQMKKEQLVRPVQVRFSANPVSVYEVVLNEERIQKMIQDGVRKKQLTFTEATSFRGNISDFNEYMSIFAPAMAKRIDSLAKPLHRKGDIRNDVLYWFDQLKRKPISAQMDAIEASIKAMELKGKVNMIGECGVGKTFMMLVGNWIYNRLHKQAMKLLVFCPDTLVNTVWTDEVKNTLHDCEVHLIKSISDLQKFEKNNYLDDTQDRVFILSQQVAKSGYTLQPAVNWSKPRGAFICPDCGSPVIEVIKNEAAATNPMEPKFIDRPVRFGHFSTERHNNYKCKKCKGVLWEPINKKTGKSSKFVYCSEMGGYFPKDTRPIKKELARLVKLANETTDPKVKARFTNQIENYRKLEMVINGTRNESRRQAVQRVSAAEYIFKKMKGRFTNLIVDEFHEMQGDSSRSEACVQLINSVPIIQTGTGTGMNGYAYSRFKTDYMMYPEKLKAAGFKIDDKERYQTTYGVTEKRYRLVKKDGKDKRDTLAPVAKPGISPVIFPLFMQDTTVFVNLSDLKDDLPKLNHYQIEVQMDPELKRAKEQLETDIKKIARHDKRMFKNSIQVGYSFLDSPTISKELKDKDTKAVVLRTPTVSAHQDHKMQELINLAKNEIQLDNRKMIVYTYFTGDGINQYLANHLEAEGFKVTVLNRQEENSLSCDGSSRKIKKDERELFIREEVKKGTEILIVNPELVKTGYNLIDFPTICYYQMSYQVYTNRQADRRAWRIGQTKDCKIVYIYYAESIQADIAALMATKIVASQAIEGNMDAAGLEAICSDRTAEEELAKKFFEGIRGKVNLNAYDTEKSKAS